MNETKDNKYSDVGKKCFKFYRIKKVFKYIYNILKQYLISDNDDSIINILKLNKFGNKNFFNLKNNTPKINDVLNA